MKMYPKCKVASLVKIGKRNGKQRYRCKRCKGSTQGKNRSNVCYEEIYDKFCFDDVKYRQLEDKYKVSKKTIQKWLDNAVFKKKICLSVKE